MIKMSVCQSHCWLRFEGIIAIDFRLLDVILSPTRISIFIINYFFKNKSHQTIINITKAYDFCCISDQERRNMALSYCMRPVLFGG